jgi:DNA modification methylase
MSAPRNLVLRGDCVEVMKTLPADSIDAIVTDPPYGIDFMGKEWDGFGTPHGFQTWTEQWAREAFRVLKPGGHLLAFGGTRMYHRLATGVEDAGFEVRDMMSWLYGSGFPKSLDVSKAMDKRRNDKAAVYAATAFVRAARDTAGKTNRDIDAHFKTNGMAGHWTSATSQPACPTWPQWLELKTLLDFGDEMDATVRELNGLAANADEAWAEREVVGTTEASFGYQKDGTRWDKGHNITAPATDDAKRWEGWGTALKPAQEPIVVARKPLIGTVAENVLAHVTGAINIDASRIAAPGESFDGLQGRPVTKLSTRRNDETDEEYGARVLRSPGQQAALVKLKELGRWPANILFDEEAAAVLDAQAPNVSRFFYVAKPGKKERNAGGTANTHPTVKPIALMCYLIRLVTPPGGVVLDPFLGSGSTACAAVLEGFDYLGIERSDEYANIAEARIAHWEKESAA